MIKHKNELAAKVNFEVAPAGLSVKARLDALAFASLDCPALCRCFIGLQEAVPASCIKDALSDLANRFFCFPATKYDKEPT